MSFDESSDPEMGGSGEIPLRGDDSAPDEEEGDNVVFLSEDYMPEDQIMSHRPSSVRWDEFSFNFTVNLNPGQI